MLLATVLLGASFFISIAYADVPIEDNDLDGVGNSLDNCPSVANADQADPDGDGIGSVCDNAPYDPNPGQEDPDADGVGTVVDNCPNLSNSGQADGDDDGVGDPCDNAPSHYNPEQQDSDGDRLGDVADNCPLTSNPNQLDDDKDGIGNACDQYMCIYTGPEICGDSIDNDCDGYGGPGPVEICSDTTAPTGRVDDPSTLGQVKGTVNVFVNAEDNQSLVKDVCLKYGVASPETEIACKPLDERDWNSYDYMPSFTFSWDSTVVLDGTYKLFAVMTDNADNIGTTNPVTVVVNNVGLGSSASNPSPITTCGEFQNISAHPGWFYRLENDIDCSGISNFTAIGEFGGQLDGQGHLIKNLRMVSRESNNRGIFDTISSGAKITGVNFTNANIFCSSTYCGGIVNFHNGTIEKTSIQGVMTCNGKCGGIASQNSGIISRSYADLTMSGELGPAGLIAGQNYSGHIENCYALGKMTASSGGNIGGIVGINEQWISYGDVVNSYAAVQLIGPGSSGGLIGWQYQRGSQSGSYWDTEVSGYLKMCGSTDWNVPESCSDANGLTTAQMKQQASFVGWNFEDIWAVKASVNGGYPYLRGVPVFVKDTTNPVITLLGNNPVSVTVGDSYSDAGATAQDDVDGSITAKINVVNTVNTATVGSYTVTYTVEDSAGNEAIPVIRTVMVKEKEVSHSQTGSKSHKRKIVQPAPVVPPPSQVLGASTFNFTMNLHIGMSGNDVTQLQKHLRTLGLFTYPTDTGYFGPITREAVIAYQKLHNITPAVGFVGPLTRAELNKGTGK